MDARLPWAVRNNALWCDLVCRSHRIQTSFAPGLWVTAERPPQFYPDAVTLQAHVAEHHVLDAIKPGPGASVKDSFATLDLAPHGFEELLRARWIAHYPLPAQSTNTSWTVVRTQHEFEAWIEAAGLTNILGAELLRHAEVRFLVAHDRNGISAGAVANLTDRVVGVSNVFAKTIDIDEAWVGIPAAVGAVFPAARLVGYEQGVGLRAAIAAGFRDLGPLRVWLAP
ncbi:MAG TPA: hypothetical protein VFI54_26820 [Solirubrobacteraceae bacterium]|nr:hypothetical protein [Solirubrobacteraceae bacterium]